MNFVLKINNLNPYIPYPRWFPHIPYPRFFSPHIPYPRFFTPQYPISQMCVTPPPLLGETSRHMEICLLLLCLDGVRLETYCICKSRLVPVLFLLATSPFQEFFQTIFPCLSGMTGDLEVSNSVYVQATWGHLVFGSHWDLNVGGTLIHKFIDA